MAIITISRDSYSEGKEVAERVCRTLGYGCFSREVLLEASTEFNIPEIKLVRALHDAPSVLERFTYGQERYLAYIEAAVLERVQKDNVVYHGLAGHFFLKDISHVLKVRILADIEERIRLEMKREGISRDEALRTLKKDDHERRQWSLKLYGMDTSDPSLYDLVIHLRKITVDDAVGLICHTAKLDHFTTTPESQRLLDNMVLSAQVKAKLAKAYPTVQVAARDGMVSIYTISDGPIAGAATREIKAMAEQVPGVRELRVDVTPVGLIGD